MILKRLNVEVEATEREEIDRLRAEGFEPIFIAPEEKEEAQAVVLEELTVKELRSMAAAKGLKLSSALRKQDIIDILEEAND